MKIIQGHDTAETAFIQPDYPYGRTLRCQRRVWVETKKGFGQRMVTQTNDPKKPFLKWNAPKPGPYYPVVVLTLQEEGDENPGYVEQHVLSPYAEEKAIQEFSDKYQSGLTERQRNTITYMIARDRAYKKVTWSVTVGSDADSGPRQTPQEQAAIINHLTQQELREMKK